MTSLAPPHRDPQRADTILDHAANWYDTRVLSPDEAFTQRVNDMVLTMRIAEARCTLPMLITLGDPDGQPLPRRHFL